MRRKAPAQILWFCMDLSQFALLRPQLESHCFDRTWTWNDPDHQYTWESGTILKVVPGDRSWKYIQGTNPDLICVDEECPQSLWNELQARGYGDKDTRYIVAATATSGAESWMRELIYDPWLKVHTDLGMDEDDAIASQRHPDIWCMPRGGIADNPSMTPEKIARFRAEKWRGGDKEWAVRNHGGFQSWSSDPVFHPEDIAWLREQRRMFSDGLGAGRDGWLETRMEAT